MELTELEVILAKDKKPSNFLITGKPEVERMKEILTIADNHDGLHVKDLAVKTALQFFTKLLENNA